MRKGCQTHAVYKPHCGLGETPKIVKRWDSKSIITISVKKRAAFTVSRLFFSIVEQGKGSPVGLRCCHPTGSLREAFYMSYLIPILSQFENHYKMVLILTLGLILLVLSGAGSIHADDHTKRTNAIYDRSEAVKRSKPKCYNHPRQDQYLVFHGRLLWALKGRV